ncbi:pseudoazurin [Sinorhizobium garamanticum]|uniref:Pseudoazurin n=1 Tax=Sinorhizobium garamanticum TaxID=680247 RepID=A0ABY8DLV7_9HYPH|nr:pseudoazurin [Sinorhizobium garamanticum]WEX90972.1 pseudoazurin [Sinorhizobium garamanticum]
MKHATWTMLCLAVAHLVTNTGQAQAAEHVIKMFNKGSDGRLMVFDPEFVVAQPGDTVRVIPTDQGHSVETMPGMWPEGANPIKGKIGQEMVVALEQDGLYGLRCLPHYFMGMVAVVVVGKPQNLDEARSVELTGKPKAAFEKLLAQAAQP